MNNINNNKLVSWLAGLVFTIVSLVLIDWCFDITRLISISSNMTAMNPLTAVSFLLICTWLFGCLHPDNQLLQKLMPVTATIVFLVGFIKLLDHIFVLPVHIDQFIFAGRLSTRTLHNAMAPTTSALFLLLGFLLIKPSTDKPAKKVVNDGIILTAFLLAYLGIIGYIYSLETFYRIGPFVPMALNTAICFLLVVVAIFVALPQGNLAKIFFSRFIGGKMVRRAVPLVLLIPPVFGYSRLLLQRLSFYDVQYDVALDTAFLVVIVLLLVFYYAKEVSKNDRERIKAEKAVIQSEETYRSLVFALKEGVIYYDKDQKILFYNPSFAEMTGYSLSELTGKNIVNALIPEERRKISDSRMADRLNGIGENYEGEILHKDGTKIIVNIVARPLLKDGVPTSFLSTMTDITERKKKEEDIEAFSASAAHDLNAPLVRIQMLTNYILELGEHHLSKEDIEYLEIILKTTVEMRTLLKDLLLFAKIGAEKINKAPIDMNEMVKGILTSAGPSKAAIRIADLPQGYGEASALKQVWTNLIHNAIKYSSKKEHPEVEIGYTQQNDKNIYYIKDNGAGFNMAEATKLFTPFKRLHADFEGNGMGLPIVKRIIEKHNGKIWAESERNKGATFYFSL